MSHYLDDTSRQSVEMQNADITSTIRPDSPQLNDPQSTPPLAPFDGTIPSTMRGETTYSRNELEKKDGSHLADEEPPLQPIQPPMKPPEHLHGMRLVLVMMAIITAVMLITLNSSVIATAIPRITDEFKSTKDIGW